MRRNWTMLEALNDRLAHSRSDDERRSIMVGFTYHQGFPVLLDTNLLFEHMHIIGPTGSGKTTLGLQTDVVQLIYRNDGPVVIFDGKGDPALFHATRVAAQRAGRTFKWFTNKPHRSTYIFNPWNQKPLRHPSLSDMLGLLTQSLNLHHGQDYGRAWFSVNARILLRRAILETLSDADKRNLIAPGTQGRLFPKYGPIQSFRDLLHIVRDLSHDSDEFRAAQHLGFIVESLTDFEQLNFAPTPQSNDPALENAIYMPEVIKEKQVIYFYLVGALDLAAVAELAKLGLYSLLAAAITRADHYGTPPRVYTLWDEAQIMIANNIETVLAQARSHGLACILSHQAMSQLNPPGGVDLRELVMACTSVKQVFGVRDPWLMQYISSTSGTTKYYRQTYNLAPETVTTGAVAPQLVYPDHDGYRRVSIQEFTGPRLAFQDILDASRDPNTSLMWIDRASGLTQFEGWFPLYTSWPTSQAQYRRYQQSHWPEKTDHTIDTLSLWPSDSQHTITPTSHPPVAPTQEEIDTSATLASIRRKLEQQ